jgi:GNAT superfamily N-acetyltransferase
MEFVGHLIGFAYVGCSGGALAELALSVLPQWRYRGVARTLFKNAVEHAVSSGILGFACIYGHPATLRIARSLGLRCSVQTADPRVIVRIPQPSGCCGCQTAMAASASVDTQDKITIISV